MTKNARAIFRHKSRWIDENDLLERVTKSVGDFASVFADMELDRVPVSEGCELPEKAITAVIGFEGACTGVAWACCSEALAKQIAGRLRDPDQTETEEGTRAAMADMVTLLGGDIGLLLSPAKRDVRLSGIEVFRSGEADFDAIVGHPDNLRCLFRHSNEQLQAGFRLDRDMKLI